jgi:hypothetical protein
MRLPPLGTSGVIDKQCVPGKLEQPTRQLARKFKHRGQLEHIHVIRQGRGREHWHDLKLRKLCAVVVDN